MIAVTAVDASQPTNVFSADDHRQMARALRLAERGRFTTKPNPVVGCVIAHGSEVVGEGWHQRAGEAHAEVHALRAAGERARGATAYVTLEPCGRVGRTPPCADALIAAGIARVVMACEDVFQQEGEGVSRLRAAGIAVEIGLMRTEARETNVGFFSRIERSRPWVRIKLGMSLDARTALADGRSQWITGSAARADVMRWRARSGAVLTGSGTVRADNPRLTVRFDEAGSPAAAGPPFVPPIRVVLDTGLATSYDSHLLDGSAPTLFMHAPDARRADHFSRVDLFQLAEHRGRLDLAEALAELARRGCNDVLIETGATLAGAFIQANLCDELVLYVAPMLLGDTARALLELAPLAELADADAWRWHDARMVGNDLRLILRPA